MLTRCSHSEYNDLIGETSKLEAASQFSVRRLRIAALDGFHRYFLLLCAIAVIRLWIFPLWNSFWLDESLIVWTIREGFAGIIPRAFVSLQSIAFCAVERLFATINMSEASLRVPSVAAAFTTVYLNYRIGILIADRELGFILAGLFIGAPAVAFEVPNARPYALAFLFQTGALYYLLLWLRSGRLRHGLLWVVFAAGAVHVQHLNVVVLPLEGMFLLLRILARRTPIRIGQFAICAVLVVALLLPALPQALEFAAQGKRLSYLKRPNWSDLLTAAAPLALLWPLFISHIIGWGSRSTLSWSWRRPGKDAALLGAVLLIVPTLAFFAVSRFTETRVFSGRYLHVTVPGTLIFWGWLLRGLKADSVRRLTMAGGLIFCIISVGGLSLIPDYRQEDWRSIIEAEPRSNVLVVYPGLVETRRLDWLQSPDRFDYFIAPVSTYRPTVDPARTYILPFDFDANAEPYGRRLTDGPLHSADSISVLVTRAYAGSAWADWMAERLRATGFKLEKQLAFSGLRLFVFRSTRKAPTSIQTETPPSAVRRRHRL